MNDTWGVAASGEDAVFTLGPDNRFEYWSRELAAVTGVGTDEMAAVDPLSLFVPGDRAAVRGAIGRCLGDGEASVRASVETPTGDSRDCQVRLFRTTDRHGTPVKIHGRVEFEVGVSMARNDSGLRPALQPSD
jgi:PAS domain S-box-containing protein